jgi:gas vesicle protein
MAAPPTGDMTPEAPAAEEGAPAIPEQTPEPITTPGGRTIFKDAAREVSPQLQNVSAQINDVFDTVVEKLEDLSDNIDRTYKGQDKKAKKEKVKNLTDHLAEGRSRIEERFENLTDEPSFLIGK